MTENKPLKGKIWLISELADFTVTRNWETNRFGIPVVECECPNCGYEFSEEEIRKLAKVEYYDEEVVRLEDVKAAILGLLKEIEKEKKIVEKNTRSDYYKGVRNGYIVAIELIKKWFADIFEEVKEHD